MQEQKNETIERIRQEGGIYDPSTKRLIPADSIDELIDLYRRMDRYARQASEIKRQCAHALAALTQSDKKTRYIRGKIFRAKITMPDESWDQSLLLEAWNSYPQFREGVLKIASIRVLKREFNKIEKESGPPDFEQFKKMLLEARKPATGTPKIQIVEGEEE